jgi:23S rRNA-/tRNA-specific pseudouridylate synthase
MRETQKCFKSNPKRYQPKGLTILYEDRDILVVDKASGLLTVSTNKVRENTAYYRLNLYVRKGVHKSRNRIFIVHRLDRDTSGVMIFSKNENAKRYLQQKWHEFKKKYFAVVHGKLPKKDGVITSYLAENRAFQPLKCQARRTQWNLPSRKGKGVSECLHLHHNDLLHRCTN